METTIATDDSLASRLALLECRFAQRQVELPGGARIAVRECGRRGAGPSIVLLHGISSGAASWLHAALVAGEQAHVLAWDAPGYGDSTPLDALSPSAEDYAQRLHELLQALEIYRCVLVGHSLGALMADGCVHGAAAGRVERLVLISPASGYGAPDQAATRDQVRRNRRAAIDELGVDGLAARIDQRLLSLAASDAQRQWVRWNTARLQPNGYLQAVDLLCNGHLGTAGPVTMPIEVHCGDADVVTPPAACRALAERLGASFELIAGAGHASPVEQPEAVARLMLRAAGYSNGASHHG